MLRSLGAFNFLVVFFLFLFLRCLERLCQRVSVPLGGGEQWEKKKKKKKSRSGATVTTDDDDDGSAARVSLSSGSSFVPSSRFVHQLLARPRFSFLFYIARVNSSPLVVVVVVLTLCIKTI